MGYKPGIRTTLSVLAVVLLLALNVGIWLWNQRGPAPGSAESREELLDGIIRKEGGERMVPQEDLWAAIAADETIGATERALLRRILDENEVYVPKGKSMQETVRDIREFADILSPIYEEETVINATGEEASAGELPPKL
jgi:hypothetical protein